ncbi:MAG: Enoyl-CoA hydratase [Pseudonocardiales bacterium]|nr:Enoyl-CoA hydratase [Pseudonocardiales bacterium]
MDLDLDDDLPGTDGVDVHFEESNVATVTISRPPNNFFDLELLTGLADVFDALDRRSDCRAIVLRGAGRHFCAGAQLSTDDDVLITRAGEAENPLYEQAVRLATGAIPVIAAIQGAAVGGGLGLALVCDFRIATPDARFAANFAQLGLHQGFGISVTLPAVVGQQHALELLYTGRRVSGTEALALGLCDRLVEPEDLLTAATELATRIANSAPLAVRAIRQTMRGDLGDRMRAATHREHVAQRQLRQTGDYLEGVSAYSERRPPEFQAR